ncbi:MAG: hypothetical protein C0594_03705, partial [Marinilabiliales bacterium]
TDTKSIKASWARFVKEESKDLANQIAEIFENDSTFIDRRNRVLDHLMARFGFSIHEVVAAYGFSAKDESAINLKLDILRNYPEMSKDRYRAAAGNSLLDLIQNEKYSGFDRRIKHLLGLKPSYNFFLGKEEFSFPEIFDTSTFNLNFDDVKYTLSVKATSEDRSIELLFAYGLDIENYQLVRNDDNRYQVKLLNIKKEVFGEVIGYFNSREDAALFIKSLVDRLIEYEKNFHKFCTLEHILLKPDNHVQCYDFTVNYKGNSIFRSESYSFNNRDAILDDLQSVLADYSNYEVKHLGDNQYKILVHSRAAQLALKGVWFYNSEEEALKDAELFAWHFGELSKSSFYQHIVFGTSFQSELELRYDPFSYNTTVLIPSWLNRFSDPKIRQQIEKTMTFEAPAHIAVHVLWVGFSEMKMMHEILTGLVSVDYSDKHFIQNLYQFLRLVFHRK